jgi:hypothetical protein
MNKANGPVERIKIGLVIGLLTVLTGCAGYWGGGYYGDTVVVAEPDMYLFGGGYDRGHDVHNYSHRGSESRGAAHSGGSRAAAHSSRSSAAAHSSGGQGGRR